MSHLNQENALEVIVHNYISILAQQDDLSWKENHTLPSINSDSYL